MDGILERAAQAGIDVEHWDGLGRHWTVEPAVLEQILDAIVPKAFVPRAIPHVIPDAYPACAAARAYQGSESLPHRSWVIVAQLFGVRSRRNWGHGDFSDLSNLIDIAAELGAAGVGLNPLHALFDDRAEEASPYFPNSRFFLNPLYIDVEAIPEFPRAAFAELQSDIEKFRQQALVDYAGVAKAKMWMLSFAYENFRKHGTAERQDQFEKFRRDRGAMLTFFAAFELMRKQNSKPWWEWPKTWQKPDASALRRLQRTEIERLGFVEYAQWIAHEQLAACRDKAKRAGLPIGLYLDLAVGVRSDGFDAWYDQNFILRSIEIGAPPDRLNTEGQRWGLAGFNPVALMERQCEPVRGVLRASMRYAGAIRLDHVMGLKRFYLIPRGMRADQGAYVHFPFEALLAAVAEESMENKCIVIGEDLGTVPPDFRQTLARWGLWSYQVMLFERAADGGFIAPELYRENALVTFATHDLPTFVGWLSGHDLVVKRGLGLDPGESDGDRAAAKEALGRAMAWRGLPAVEFLAAMKFLADTPSRLLAVTLEDVLALVDQVNVPGTVTGHPNWQRRLPVNLEDLLERSCLKAVCKTMASTGRRIHA